MRGGARSAALAVFLFAVLSAREGNRRGAARPVKGSARVKAEGGSVLAPSEGRTVMKTSRKPVSGVVGSGWIRCDNLIWSTNFGDGGPHGFWMRGGANAPLRRLTVHC